MSTPNRTGLAGFWAAASAASVPGVAPSASVAAPSVFTNVRRSAGMSSIMLQLSFDRGWHVDGVRLLAGEDLHWQPVLPKRDRTRRVGVERARRVVRLVEVQHGRPIVEQVGVQEARGFVGFLPLDASLNTK